ncbi:hypothetical protein QJS04_geneDACA024446 [Acorus gramineus]|uniref:Disease resistance R13L4/SHOC-2-like LRR domain-containing protein n=1 Tax=Acorus gramineus TaxID=55184 RepID=A0AAV8ZYY9_ACOGR|nr:hypothetical protein QJS04_geneDACA024446 [Acorus gramineus]
MFFSLSKLRALHLGNCVGTDLPDSIGSLKHLRYIDLSHGRFRVLPRSICSLRNLQVLILFLNLVCIL